jgi:protein-disulfide isomerase
LGRFTEAVDALFDKQDSLGKRSWNSYARDAGVTDTAQFGGCMADSSAGNGALVNLGATLADSLGIHATPTIILNGWRYSYVPSEKELVRAIDALLAGQPPYPGFPKARSKALNPFSS